MLKGFQSFEFKELVKTTSLFYICAIGLLLSYIFLSKQYLSLPLLTQQHAENQAHQLTSYADKQFAFIALANVFEVSTDIDKVTAAIKCNKRECAIRFSDTFVRKESPSRYVVTAKEEFDSIVREMRNRAKKKQN